MQDYLVSAWHRMHYPIIYFDPSAVTSSGLVSNVKTAEGVMIAAAVEKSYSARTRS